MRYRNCLIYVALVLVTSSVHAQDTLEQFAQKCDQAIGVTVPDFECTLGTLVPATNQANNACDRPDQLHQDCDPGSRFQVLTNNANAYVVAHCRKRHEDINDGRFGDIAVIQYNKVTGATCFYQGALDLSHNGSVKAPSKGVGTPPFWKTPSEAANIRCVMCHDNGPIIRSPYLTQITGHNTLPGAGDTTFNRNQPYFFVGSDFTSWKAFKVEVTDPQGNPNLCNRCHRMGVNNLSVESGTARDFGIRATASSDTNKNAHSSASPMWMLLGETSFDQAHADAALAIKNCADQFNVTSPLPNSSTCKITQFTGVTIPSSFGLVFLLREGNGSIWVVFNGARFHVPDSATLNRLYDGMPVLQVPDGLVEGIPTIPIDASLLREENGAIWVVFGQAKFHVPDPATFARLFGGKPMLQLWDGGPNGISNAPTDGSLLREENGAIWVVFGQAKFHVPDPPTLTRLFDGKPISQLWNGALDGISKAPSDGTMLREEDGAIWVVFGRAKFLVPDPPTLVRLFGDKPVFQLWNGALSEISNAPADGTLLREENGAIWVVFGQAKFHVPDPPTLTRLFDGTPISQLWNGALSGISNIPVDGTLFREESSTQIYKILNGAKLAVPSNSFGVVHILWNGALSQIP